MYSLKNIEIEKAGMKKERMEFKRSSRTRNTGFLL